MFLLHSLVAQLPTPTPLPPAPPAPFELPQVSMWDYAQSTVGWYNELPLISVGAPIVLLLISLIVAFRMVYGKIRQIGRRDE